MKFANNNGCITCRLETHARQPPLPGGYKLGEKLYYTGASETFETATALCTASKVR